jgi:hypothetical protein
MDADLGALPDDLDALKAALLLERARMREVTAECDVRGAELAVARAKASEDLALIAHQKPADRQARAANLRPPVGAVIFAHRADGAGVRGTCSKRHRG